MTLVEGPGLAPGQKAQVFGLYVAVAIVLDQFHLNDAIQVTNALVLATFALGHLAVSRPLYRQGLRETRVWGLVAAAMAVATISGYPLNPARAIAGTAAFLLLDAIVEGLGWKRTRFGLLKSTLMLVRRFRPAAHPPSQAETSRW